jgi:uncharacterized OsmC-like protein
MSAPSDAAPPTTVLDQVERFRFEASFPGTTLTKLTLDEPVPTGTGSGPDPVQDLAVAVGHCLSSTLASSLERAHVATGRIRTSVWTTMGRNANGRLRVVGLRVTIEAAPIDPSDRDRFARCVEVFEEYCPVTGAVRQAIPTAVEVRPSATVPGT